VRKSTYFTPEAVEKRRQEYQQELDVLLDEIRRQHDRGEKEAYAWDAWAEDYAFDDSQLAAIQESAFHAGWFARDRS